MKMVCLLLVVALFSSTNDRPTEISQSSVVRTIVPQFAKGFSVDILADSSVRLVLLNLQHSSDTLDVVELRPVAGHRYACLSTTHLAMMQHPGMLDRVVAVEYRKQRLE